MSKRRDRKSTKRKRAAASRRVRSPSGQGPSNASPDSCAAQLSSGAQSLADGQIEVAQRRFENALRIEPRSAVAMNCLGIVHRLRGDPQCALSFFQQALQVRPDFAEAHNNAGNTYRDLDQLSAAADSYRRAIELKPAFAQAHNNLGVVHLSLGEWAAAIDQFEVALGLNPGYGEAFNNLATAQREAGNLEAARTNYTRALQFLPNSAEVRNNLANVFRDLGDLDSAQRHYEEALARQPEMAEARDNLGTVLFDQGDIEGAIRAYRRAVQLQPNSADLLVNLGNAFKEQSRIEEARLAYQRAAQLDPVNRLHAIRVSSLCPPVFADRAALEAYRQAAHREWKEFARGELGDGDSLLSMRLAEPAFSLQFLDGNLRPLKEAYAGIYEHRFPQQPLAPRRRGKPTVGVVVTRTHEGIFLKSMRGVLERLRNDQYEVTVVCPQASAAMIRGGIARDINILPLPHSFRQMGERIRAAAFDVLYYWEVGSDATNYFLPFLRLAPVQCTSWGLQVTSGISNVDFYLSSDLVEPPAAQEHYSERLIRATTLLTYQFRDTAPAAPRPREAYGLSTSQHVYLCPQQLGKFHPDFDAILAAILEQDPCGVLVLVEDRHAVASQLLRKRMVRSLGSLLDRVQFLPRQNRSDYVALIHTADVLLDPPHFGGVNTTYDALAAGKPIVTCPAEYHRGRYTLGCYRKMGIDACVAADSDQYVTMAVGLASDHDLRSELERRLRSASEVLFEDPQAVSEHERIFTELVEIAGVRRTQE